MEDLKESVDEYVLNNYDPSVAYMLIRTLEADEADLYRMVEAMLSGSDVDDVEPMVIKDSIYSVILNKIIEKLAIQGVIVNTETAMAQLIDIDDSYALVFTLGDLSDVTSAMSAESDIISQFCAMVAVLTNGQIETYLPLIDHVDPRVTLAIYEYASAMEETAVDIPDTYHFDKIQTMVDKHFPNTLAKHFITNGVLAGLKPEQYFNSASSTFVNDTDIDRLAWNVISLLALSNLSLDDIEDKLEDYVELYVASPRTASVTVRAENFINLLRGPLDG